jgi:phosphoribosylanthranilate isomerase
VTRIKICGITRWEDAEEAVAAGADALGFVMEPSSPRCVADSEFVKDICAKLPPYVYTVAVFGPPPTELPAVGIHAIQCEGTIAHSVLQTRKWIEVLRLRYGTSGTNALDAAHPGAGALLVDAYDPAAFGGTGTRADWDVAALVREQVWPRPMILAGGLNAANVGEAICKVRPFAVDVSSGVEREPGVKDAVALRRFCEAVREADRKFGI